MKVVEVVYNLPAETFIQRHVQALKEIQFPIRVVARHSAASLSASASLGESNEMAGSEIMPNFNHLEWAGKLASLRFLTTKSIRLRGPASLSEKTLLGYFERLRPDLIHFQDASLAAAMSWIPLALSIPYTLSVRGSDIQVLTLESSEQRDATISAIKNATKVHAVCHDLGLKAARLLGRDLEFTVIYTTLPIPSSLPSWTGLPVDGQAHFISSGRIVWMKGFPDLLLALRTLRDKGMNARLTIVGVGPELDRLLFLRKMLGLESVIEFPGKLNYEQIQNLFCGAHAYIQSSVSEGLSNSLAEAMANGLPVFATKVGGTQEVIEDGVSGFLLQPLTPQDWVEKLMYIRDTALMERVRTSAFEKSGLFFSAERHARAFASFFQEAFRKREK